MLINSKLPCNLKTMKTIDLRLKNSSRDILVGMTFGWGWGFLITSLTIS